MTVALVPVNFLQIAYASIMIFSIFLVAGQKQYKALAMLLATHAIQQIFNILEELNITADFVLVTPAIQLAIGPLYYLFTRNLVEGDLNLRKSSVHLLPAVVALGFTTWWPTLLQIAYGLLIIYFFASFHLLRRYHKVIADITADADRYSLTWLIYVLGLIFIVECVDFTRLNLQLYLDRELLIHWYFFSLLIALSYTLYLVLKAMRQPLLYSSISALEQQVSRRGDDEAEQARAIFLTIERHVRGNLTYRKLKYSLRELADEMGLTEQLVSWAINQGGEKSFSDYINALRVEDVKAALSSQNHKTNLLDAAFNAGFSSKSSFNSVFKRHTGITPSQYLKQNLQPAPPR